MNCVNEVELIGHVGTDIETISNDPLGVRFKLATNERYFSKTKSALITTTEWHVIKCWKSNAKFTLDKVKKSDYVRIKGKIHYHEYTTEDNKKGRNAEIIVSSIIKLPKKSVSVGNGNEIIED